MSSRYDAGLDDGEILEANQIICYANYMNRSINGRRDHGRRHCRLRRLSGRERDELSGRPS